MRINIYNEEFTTEIEIVEAVAKDTGLHFYGLRVFLKSPDDLHHSEEDDDRSAVTFWADNRGYLLNLVGLMRSKLDSNINNSIRTKVAPNAH